MPRNIFELLLSSEVKTQKNDGGFVLSYHSTYQNGRLYKEGSMVRFREADDTFSIYICVKETIFGPDVSSDWEIISNNIVLPYDTMIDVNGLTMIDVDGKTLKVV